MPHYKCVACRVRLETTPVRADSVAGACPQCGLPLDPVVDLAGLIGFRRVVSLDGPPREFAGGSGDTFDDPAAGAVAMPSRRPGEQ